MAWHQQFTDAGSKSSIGLIEDTSCIALCAIFNLSLLASDASNTTPVPATRTMEHIVSKTYAREAIEFAPSGGADDDDDDDDAKLVTRLHNTSISLGHFATATAAEVECVAAVDKNCNRGTSATGLRSISSKYLTRSKVFARNKAAIGSTARSDSIRLSSASASGSSFAPVVAACMTLFAISSSSSSQHTKFVL
jgi:hypothetical protein